MSNSRMFCIAVFVVFSGLCTLSNHHLLKMNLRTGWSEPISFWTMAILAGIAAVTLLGDRRR